MANGRPMKVDIAVVSAPQTAERFDSALQHPPATYPASVERRSPARLGSRGDKHRMSPSVVVNIVQVSDLLLLLFSRIAGQKHVDAAAVVCTPTAHSSSPP